jgi:hypothetical protein
MPLQTEFEIQVLNELALYPIADTFICGNLLILTPISGDKTTSFAGIMNFFRESDEAHKPGDHFSNSSLLPYMSMIVFPERIV